MFHCVKQMTKATVVLGLNLLDYAFIYKILCQQRRMLVVTFQ